MKFTGTKWGAAVVVVVSAGSFGWKAASSENGIIEASMPAALFDPENRVADAVLTNLLPAPPSLEPMTQEQTLWLPETTESTTSHGFPDLNARLPEIFDKPPVSDDGNHKAQQPLSTSHSTSVGGTTAIDPEAIAEFPPSSSSEAETRSESAQELVPDDQKLVEEAAARRKVVDMLGGESAMFAQECDLAGAYSAAKKALRSKGISLSSVSTLAVIDFTLPSFDRRLALYDPATGEESRHLVAHGRNTGELYAEYFSNTPRSFQSSPGLYRVGKHYRGKHGPSIRLHGLQQGINDRAFARDVVLHSAWYVSYQTILENQLKLGVPRIGRSHGCPAVSTEDLPLVMEKLELGSYIFIHADPRPGLAPVFLQQVSTTQSEPQ